MTWSTSGRLVAINIFVLSIFLSWIQVYKSVSTIERNADLIQPPIRAPVDIPEEDFQPFQLLWEMWDLSFTLFMTSIVMAGIVAFRL